MGGSAGLYADPALSFLKFRTKGVCLNILQPHDSRVCHLIPPSSPPPFSSSRHLLLPAFATLSFDAPDFVVLLLSLRLNCAVYLLIYSFHFDHPSDPRDYKGSFLALRRMKYLTTVVRGLPHGTTSKDVENDFNLSIDSDSPCVAGPTVKELQGNTCSTTVTFRSEKHDKKRNCDSLRDHFNRSHFRGSSSTISVTDGFYGLTPLSGEVNAPIQYVPRS